MKTQENLKWMRLLGRGAFSEVYLVEDERGYLFACKVSENHNLLKTEAYYMQLLQADATREYHDNPKGRKECGMPGEQTLKYHDNVQARGKLELQADATREYHDNLKDRQEYELCGGISSENHNFMEIRSGCKSQTNPFPKFYDLWRDGDKSYLLMEYIPGKSPMQVKNVLELASIGRQLTEILMKLQAQNPPLVFRDIKPDNLIVTPEGKLRLLDLGLVCPAGPNTICAGSPGYAAPEQFIINKPLTSAADIYGMGQAMKHGWIKQSRKHKHWGNKNLSVPIWRARWQVRQMQNLLKRCTEENTQKRLADLGMIHDILKILEMSTDSEKVSFSVTQREALKGHLIAREEIVHL